ncbi:MAG: YHYH protein [Patescibacteria group bacterium]
MTLRFRHRAQLLVLLILFFLPFIILAHVNHPVGAPAHPIDSPEYHEVETTSVSSNQSALQAQITMLLQLIELLKQQLALRSGTSISEIDAMTTTPASSVGEGITTTGDLVMTTDSNYRYFSSDGLPEYSISGNRYANTASAQDHEYRVALTPEQNSSPTYYELPFTFGIALNGVTFEPFAAEWYQNDRDSGWQEDPFVTLPDLDDYNAHVQPNGLYHYHGQPTNLIDGATDGAHSPIIGFAADGFPLYGPYVYEDADDAASDIIEIDSNYQLKSGTRSGGPGGSHDGTYNEDYEHVAGGSSDLDECNGRYGVTPEYPDGTYYYVATESFPYIPRCLMGDMDLSFVAGPPR